MAPCCGEGKADEAPFECEVCQKLFHEQMPRCAECLADRAWTPDDVIATCRERAGLERWFEEHKAEWTRVAIEGDGLCMMGNHPKNVGAHR